MCIYEIYMKYIYNIYICIYIYIYMYIYLYTLFQVKILKLISIDNDENNIIRTTRIANKTIENKTNNVLFMSEMFFSCSSPFSNCFLFDDVIIDLIFNEFNF